MLDRISGKQHDAVAGADALPAQEARDGAGQLPKRTVADGTAVIGGHDVGLVGMPIGGAIDPLPEQAGTGIGTVQCNIAHLVSRRRDLIAVPRRATSVETPDASG